jgi:hypothetical protein
MIGAFRDARTSETSVHNHFTRQYIPEDISEHHNRRPEYLKSHMIGAFRDARTSETSVTIILHGSISQKTTLNIILAAVRT